MFIEWILITVTKCDGMNFDGHDNIDTAAMVTIIRFNGNFKYT